MKPYCFQNMFVFKSRTQTIFPQQCALQTLYGLFHLVAFYSMFELTRKSITNRQMYGSNTVPIKYALIIEEYNSGLTYYRAYFLVDKNTVKVEKDCRHQGFRMIFLF